LHFLFKIEASAASGVRQQHFSHLDKRLWQANGETGGVPVMWWEEKGISIAKPLVTVGSTFRGSASKMRWGML
jgi:hypothetical protein